MLYWISMPIHANMNNNHSFAYVPCIRAVGTTYNIDDIGRTTIEMITNDMTGTITLEYSIGAEKIAGKTTRFAACWNETSPLISSLEGWTSRLRTSKLRRLGGWRNARIGVSGNIFDKYSSSSNECWKSAKIRRSYCAWGWYVTVSGTRSKLLSLRWEVRSSSPSVLIGRRNCVSTRQAL